MRRPAGRLASARCRRTGKQPGMGWSWAGALVAALAAWPIGCTATGGQAAEFTQGGIVVGHVVAAEPVAPGTAAQAAVAVYLSIANRGNAADTLTGVESPIARRALVHDQMSRGGMMTMVARTALPVPAHDVVRLAPGGTHIMLEGVARPVAAGDTVPLILVFRRGGRLAVRALVVSYADLVRPASAGPASTGPAPVLRLARSDGAVFDLAAQRGDVVVVFFGYTHCPDLCPLTLADFAWVRRRLGPRAAQVRFVFVTVDPARDSPARAMAYARQFDSSFVGLSGDSARLADVQRAFHVASWVTRDSAGNVVVAHSASVFVVGRDGALARVLSHEEADVDRLYAAVSDALGS